MGGRAGGLGKGMLGEDPRSDESVPKGTGGRCGQQAAGRTVQACPGHGSQSKKRACPESGHALESSSGICAGDQLAGASRMWIPQALPSPITWVRPRRAPST